MFNGCFYLWANISVYVLSYIYQFDPLVNQDAIFYVDVALCVLLCIGYQFGAYLLNTRGWNPKLILLLGGTIALSGITMSSYTTSLSTFIIFYGIFSGIGCGTMYMIPLVCCWEYFPKQKGLMTGIIVGSFGFGSFVFSQISTWIANPNNVKASIYINDDLSYFPPEVANRVPKMFRQMVLIWTCQWILAMILISRP